MNRVPVIIPAYEPDERLIELLKSLCDRDIGPVIVVDDGSGGEYRDIFDRAGSLIKAADPDSCVLTHDENGGKGKALKTAFSYVLANMPKSPGAVTADSDGQHTAECINKVRTALENSPGSLVLGVRTFDGDDIPWKSRMGNKITIKVFHYLTGLNVSDTQTGLRGIPAAFMAELLNVRYDRFEFEMEMLLLAGSTYPVKEVPIETVYESKNDHKTHFRPFVDSVRIYKILGKRFLKFIIASLSSSILDLLLFALFVRLLRDRTEAYIIISTILARVFSAVYNYAVNYKAVFKSREHPAKAAAKYFALAVVQMSASAVLVNVLAKCFAFIPEVVVKAVVDTALFFVSYVIQRKYVFAKTGEKSGS